MPPDSTRSILPEPPAQLKRLSEELLGRIVTIIREQGPIPFSHYMEMALYEPGLGYYSAGLHKFGAEGDFVTAPELGTVFARCLARQVNQLARELGSYDILEAGAGSGALAIDLLNALDEKHRPTRYRILERSADLKHQQQIAIERSALASSVAFEWVDTPPVEPWTGIILANEVIDALPVERFVLDGAGVQQLCVAESEGQLKWASRPAPESLAQPVSRLTGDNISAYPPGYRSEICTLLAPWLRELASGLERGTALFIDYGYPRDIFYAPERGDGTLICNYRHRAHDDPFYYPGLQDITAFVDFTALAEAAGQCGLDVAGYTSQSSFLLDCGLDQVLAGMESLPARERIDLANEVRRLTLPSEMGEKFQVMALSRDLDTEPVGFRSQDLRFRL